VTQNGGALSLSILGVGSEELLTQGVAARPDNLSWFALQTRPRHEKKVSLGLKEKGVRSFLPLRREKRLWSDRQQWLELPLFSHYVFVHIPVTTESRVRVLRTHGVVRFAGVPGCGTPVPDEQIENLQAIMDQRIALAPHEFIKVGERVRIRGGALNGIEGILAAIKNDRSLVVSVDLIQKSVAIRIDGFEVEPA
jgi:transcription antitermination factor NusG